MSTNLIEAIEEDVGAVCARSNFTERLSRYLDDPLNCPEAEEIEDHLLDCRFCREFVDAILSIRGEAARTARGNDHARKDGRPIRIATFRKGRLQGQ